MPLDLMTGVNTRFLAKIRWFASLIVLKKKLYNYLGYLILQIKCMFSLKCTGFV